MNSLLKMKTGQKALIKIHDNSEQLNLSISATEFRMREQSFTLVSLQNIQSELEEKELEAWQQLIRVLTHEIMNSVTPIASLAATVNETFNFNDQKSQLELSEESKSDIEGALKTIQKRSEGLLHFVDAYRGLTRIPTPDFTKFSVLDLLERVRQLMQTEISKKKIQCQIEVVKGVTVALKTAIDDCQNFAGVDQAKLKTHFLQALCRAKTFTQEAIAGYFAQRIS